MLAGKLVAGLLSSETGLSDYFRLNLDPIIFKGPEKELYKHLQHHVLKYGSLPSKDTLEKNIEFIIPSEVDETPAFYRDQMYDRYVFHTLKGAMLSAQDQLNGDKPLDALEALKETILRLHLHGHKGKVVDYAAEGFDVVQTAYNQANTGLDTGLSFGWPYLDRMTAGLQGGDVVSFVGRPGLGKTYMLLFGALHAWSQGLTPLFVSMEIKPLGIMQRLAAMDAVVPITGLKQGALSSGTLAKVRKKLKSNQGKASFWLVDGAVTSTMDDLIMYAQQFKPDVLYIDGAYLVRSSNPRLPRWERVTENAERIKSELAEKLNIPVIVSYQFNRKSTAKENKEPGLENIAYSDAIGQLSSVVLGLMEEESVETLEKRHIWVLKGRNGERGEFDIHWDFDKGPGFMDFSEIEYKSVSDLQFI